MRDRVKKDPAPIFVETLMAPRFEKIAPLNYRYILQVHAAWIVMLERQGLVAPDAAKKLYAALAEMDQQGPAAVGEFNPKKEELYFHIESALSERLGGDIAGNVSLARTRPEPIVRMAIRDRILDNLDALILLRTTLRDLAERHADALMPGYTHMLHAQPTTLGHYLLAIQDTLTRDAERLLASYDRVNLNTLGSAALAGTSLPIDRDLTSDLLGFSGLVENTYDCVSSADFIAEPAAALAVMHTTISRVAMQFVLWHSVEFAMMEVRDDFAVISSLMPQKKNPSPLEYIRGRSAIVSGNLMSVLGAHHNTCFEDVLDIFSDIGPLVCDTVEMSTGMLRLLSGLLETSSFNTELMHLRLTEGFCTASGLAEMLVERAGVSYRKAHNVVASVVRECLEQGKTMVDVDAALVNRCGLAALSIELAVTDEWVRQAVTPILSLPRYKVPGGPAPDEVRRMARQRLDQIDLHRAEVTKRRDALDAAARNLHALTGV